MYFKKRTKKGGTDISLIRFYLEDFYINLLQPLKEQLITFKSNLTKEELHRNFDKYHLQFTLLKNTFNYIYSSGLQEFYEERLYSNPIEDDIFINLVKTIKSLIVDLESYIYKSNIKEREELINKLFAIDNFKSSQEEIKEILRWLYDYLQLDKLEFTDKLTSNIPSKHIDTYGAVFLNKVTLRQMNTFKNCLNHASNNNFYEAYHSLCEFIDNYQFNIYEPLNNFEKLAIKLMIIIILSI